MTQIVQAIVYVKDDNRLIIPGHWYCDDDPDIGLGSLASCLVEGMMFSVVCNMKTDRFISIESGPNGCGEIAHFPYDILGRQFAHGGIRVLLIGGPLFDEEMSKVLVEPEKEEKEIGRGHDSARGRGRVSRPFRLSRREAERLRRECETAEFVARAKLQFIQWLHAKLKGDPNA